MTTHEIRGFVFNAGELDPIAPKSGDGSEVVAAYDLFLDSLGCSRVGGLDIEVQYDIDRNRHELIVYGRYVNVSGILVDVPRNRTAIEIRTPEEENKE